MASARSALLRLQPNLLPVLLGVFLLGLVAPASAQAQVLISNTGQVRTQDSKGNLAYDRVQRFTTGSHIKGYTVSSVDIVFRKNELDDLFRKNNPRLTVSIRNASSGLPGTIVGTLNLPASSQTFESTRTITFTAPGKGIQLSPSTTYAVVIDSIDLTGSNAQITLLGSNAEDAGGATGFSIADFSYWYFLQWWSNAKPFKFSIKGEPIPIITDQIQMSNATRNIAEFGNDKDAGGSLRVVVEIGDEGSLKGIARTINYKVGGSADRGNDADDPKDYYIDGCESSTCTVRLPANRHSAVININVKDDGLDENDETIVLTLQDGAGYTVNDAKKTTTVTIADDDTRGLTFYRKWPDVQEGGSGNLTVKLASQPTEPVEVSIVSNNPDVTTTPTSLLFNPTSAVRWDTAQTVTVHAAHDSDAVNDEAILTYTTSGGDYGGANALSIDRPVSVDDDDTSTTTGPQLPRISLTGGADVTEGSAASFTVNADPAPTAQITVNVDVIEPPGQDFVAANQEGVRTVVLNAGETSATFTVPTVNDTTDEDDGFVQVYVNDGTGYIAGQGAAVDVNDNDGTSSNNAPTVANAIPDQSATVGIAFSYAFPANTFHDADNDSLTYSATQSDNSALPSWLTFNANTRTFSGTPQSGDTGTLPVKVTANDRNSGSISDTFDLVVSAPIGSIITVTGPSPITEGANAVFTFNLSPVSAADLTVNITATQSGDFFTPNSLQSTTSVIPAGNTSSMFRPPARNDAIDEPDGSVTLTVHAGTGYTVGSPSSTTIVVKDDDPTVVSLARVGSGALNEGDKAEFTVTLGRALIAGEIIDVPLSISGTQVTPADWSLSTKTGATNTGITLQDINTATPSVRFAGAGAHIATLELTATADRTTESTETFTVALGNNNAFDANTLGTNVGGGADPHSTDNRFNVTVNNVVPPVNAPTIDFARATSSAREDAGTHNVTVNLSPAAPSGGLTLGYSVTGTATAGSDFTISNSGTVTVSVGATSATIPVAINDDSTEESAETVILTLITNGTGYTLGSTTVHTLTITDNDDDPGTTDPPGPGNNGGNQGVSGSEGEDDDENDQDGQNQDPTPATSVVAFAADTSRPREDAGTADVTVTFTPAPAAALTVHYTVTGTATAGRDFTALAGSVAVSAGATRVTIPVGLTDDRMDEGAETVILTLTDGGGYTVGETQVHTLTITDNDTAGLRASPTTVHLAETGEQATVSVHLTSQPTDPVTVTFASSRGRVATIAPATLLFTPDTWQTPQTVTITAGADGLATLRGTVQSNDRGYAALASGALPHIRVRVGADLTGLTTPWLARFGRTVTSQAVTGVTARLSAARTPGLTGTVAGLALDRVGEEAAPATTRLAPATQLAPTLAPSDPRLNPGGQQLTLRDILAGSAFALTSDPSATGGSYALWGQGAWTHFAGQAGAQDVEGNVLSGTLGVDWAQGAWVLGVAVSHTQGDGDAAQTTAQGDLASSLTLVTPYVGVDVTEHLSLWGTMGYGRGTVGLTRPTASEVETDLSLFLVAGGVRERLLEPAPTGGLAVAVRSEARFLRTMADADTAQGLAASEADVGLLRVGLESSWQQPLADGGAVVPRLDLGFRQDLGEAETGLGLEVQGGVRWEAPAHGLTLDVTGQTLLAHSDQEFETWGGSATVQWAANPNSAAGPALTLRQTYGAGTGTGATTFWTENPVALLQAPGPAELRLTADFGWGVPLQAGLGVPHVQYGWAPTSRDVTLGWRLLPTRATEMTLELTATHREAVRTAPVQGVALSLTRQW